MIVEFRSKPDGMSNLLGVCGERRSRRQTRTFHQGWGVSPRTGLSLASVPTPLPLLASSPHPRTSLPGSPHAVVPPDPQGLILPLAPRAARRPDGIQRARSRDTAPVPGPLPFVSPQQNPVWPARRPGPTPGSHPVPSMMCAPPSTRTCVARGLAAALEPVGQGSSSSFAGSMAGDSWAEHI